jgi:hypothetical protein
MFDEKAQEQFQAACAKTRERLREAGMDGPWMSEPDRVEWKHAGLTCLMIRHQELFHWCGYVGMPPGHPCHGKGYDAIQSHYDSEGNEREPLADIDVHGGLTYANACSGHICHKPAPGEPDALHWLGFDCAHLGDLSPAMEMHRTDWPQYVNGMSDRYRDLLWVRAETERLAEQLAAITAAKGADGG